MRIKAELNLPSSIELREIKSEVYSNEELSEMVKLTKSYEALFNRRSVLYREYNLKEKTLSEEDYKHYIESHYSFLKRPVLVYENNIFVGNSKREVEASKEFLNEK